MGVFAESDPLPDDWGQTAQEVLNEILRLLDSFSIAPSSYTLAIGEYGDKDIVELILPRVAHLDLQSLHNSLLGVIIRHPPINVTDASDFLHDHYSNAVALCFDQDTGMKYVHANLYLIYPK